MKRRTEVEDIELWIAFRKGDEIAFEDIYRFYYPLLISYGRKFTTDRYLIEESAQDLFVKLWNNRHTLSTPQSVKPYLLKSYRSVIFRKIQRLTARNLDRIDDIRYTFSLEPAHEQKVIDDEEEREKTEKIKLGLEKLTSRQREAIYLRFYQNLSYDEISEVLQIETGGTYKLIYRALGKLKEDLGPSLFTLFLTSLTSSSLLV